MEYFSKDPIGFEAGDANFYRYVGNSPTLFVDSNGLSAAGFIKKLVDLKDFVKSLPKQLEKLEDLTPKQKALITDLGQLALDIAGIFEPTPFCDGTNALISILRGNFLDAVLSGAGVIPYLGDVAKTGKVPKYIGSIKDAVKIAEKSADMRKAIVPLLEKLDDILRSAPLDSCPEAIRRPIQRLTNEIGNAVKNLKKLDTPVSEILKGKKASIKRAKLPPNSPAWSEIEKMPWADIVEGAEKNKPGYKTIKKLLTDGGYNK